MDKNYSRTITNETHDEERAFYALRDTAVTGCVFEGPADGESALKECRDIAVTGCDFRLRYPLWHVENFTLGDSKMTDTARAALWYAKNGVITDCELGGIKALRECESIRLDKVTAVSPEFGWKCRNLEVCDTSVTSEYVFLELKDARFERFSLKGKYSFQYSENVTISDSVLDTKDAFWHCKNVTVRDSVVKGEYLAWYSDGLTLINCRISGTQPLCYCRNLTLIGCTMEGTDLSFENSDVNADISGSILSVKNPVNGHITAGAIGEIIMDEHRIPGNCVITETERK